LQEVGVAIVGAGPAGISTALALRQRGVDDVVVLDRARFPRDKPCGGGLTGHASQAMAALGLELDVPFEAAPRAEVRFGAQRREITLERPVRVVRRVDFDASLVRQAAARGVEVRAGAPVESLRIEPDGVTLDAGGAALRARVVVGADGAGSVVRKTLRKGRARPIRLFRAELPAPGWRRDTMLYDFSPMAAGLRGYAWIFPSPAGVNVGLMHDPGTAQSGAALHALLEAALAPHGISSGVDAHGWPAWGYDAAAPVAGPRALLVGDAAGIDALTGEGIAVGMEQALVAAEHIAAGLAGGDFRFAGYRRAIRRATVGRELTLDGRMARMLYGESWRRWLPMVFFDEGMLELYAARICGSLILADQRMALLGALFRAFIHGRKWTKQLG
jgi:geranylgeranyl reductase family protein